MHRNSFVKMTKLPNVKGRIYYISSPVRQENLYAVYETTERSFWTELAKCNQTEFIKSGTDGKCIEARELIIALPESFVDYEPKALLKLFTEHFKQNYGTECIAALHHNKRKTNYHTHLIFSERKLLEIPTEKVATRNMFYDETGKHVRTKKEILDDSSQIRAGCKVVPKGDVYERNLFTTTDSKFKGEKFLEDVKHSYTDLINLYVRNDKDKLKVFDRNGVYLPMKKIGKNNPKAEQIVADNEIRTRWNETVDQALVCGIPEQRIMEVKQEQISKRASQSMRLSGKRPDLFAGIVQMAITALKLFINRIFRMEEPERITSSKMGANAPNTEVKTEKVQKPAESMKSATKTEQKPPERPKKSELASKFPRLEEVYRQLQNQSAAIYKKEQSVEELEQELSETKGMFKGKQRKALQGQIEQAQTQLFNMKQGLQNIVKRYGYKSVNAFMTEFNASKTEYAEYQKAVQNYERKLAGKPEKVSILERLQRGQQEIREREAGRQHTVTKSKDRGGR
ncbi:hypothetical protein GCM10008922_47360 [Faecalicatena contorta]|uniref:MobA/MobL family protein n=1 Tax=Faecalicatena contorta TaxID=39482 RepID=UPI0031DA8382